MQERRNPGVVAYFSMEMALDPAMPTYSGGLGVLAGDTLRAAADAGLDMVAVTLLYNEGYFTQVLDVRGNQLERPVSWDPERREGGRRDRGTAGSHLCLAVLGHGSAG